MFLHINHHKEVSRRPAELAGLAFSLQAQLGTGIHAGRYFYRNASIYFYPASAAALVTRIGDDTPLASAGRARGTDLKETLGSNHLAPALTGGADLGFAARGDA
jgi:hypothetical protein